MFYNWNVIGHERELVDLEKDFTSGNINHAYLFVGPEEIGKFRVAKSIAEILQCPNDFCHTCPTCIQIVKKCHADTIELDDDGESIKVEAIRDIIARLNMTSQSNYKILLIENIGRLTAEASNCILKTLEEPPPKTVFIFTASQLRDIMPTVASRMRIVHFRKVPDEILSQALKSRFPGAAQDTIDQVILLSLGRSGRAIQLMTNPEKFQEVRDLYRHIQFLDENATKATRILSAQELAVNPQKMRSFLSLLVHHFRRKMLQEKSSEKKAHEVHIIEEIHRVIDLLSKNVNPRVLLEHIMIQL